MTHSGEHIDGVEYFNGMGLNYSVNVRKFLLLMGVLTPSSPADPLHLAGIASLLLYRHDGGTVICPRIYGDPVSLFGDQTGEIRTYYAEKECVAHQLSVHGNSPNAVTAILAVGYPATFSFEIPLAAGYYGDQQWGSGWGGFHIPIINGNAYMWSVHETDSFFYKLGRQDSGYDRPTSGTPTYDKLTEN